MEESTLLSVAANSITVVNTDNIYNLFIPELLHGDFKRPGRLACFDCNDGFKRPNMLDVFGGLPSLGCSSNPGGTTNTGGLGNLGGPGNPGNPGNPKGPKGPDGPDSEQYCIGEDVGGGLMSLFRFLIGELNETPELNNDFNLKIMQEILSNFINNRKQIISGMSDIDNFLTACQIENIYDQEKNKHNDILFRDYFNTIRNVKNEMQLVELKKKSIKSKE
jgi:hypothetical protein